MVLVVGRVPNENWVANFYQNVVHTVHVDMFHSTLGEIVQQLVIVDGFVKTTVSVGTLDQRARRLQQQLLAVRAHRWKRSLVEKYHLLRLEAKILVIFKILLEDSHLSIVSGLQSITEARASSGKGANVFEPEIDELYLIASCTSSMNLDGSWILASCARSCCWPSPSSFSNALNKWPWPAASYTFRAMSVAMALVAVGLAGKTQVSNTFDQSVVDQNISNCITRNRSSAERIGTPVCRENKLRFWQLAHVFVRKFGDQRLDQFWSVFLNVLLEQVRSRCRHQEHQCGSALHDVQVGDDNREIKRLQLVGLLGIQLLIVLLRLKTGFGSHRAVWARKDHKFLGFWPERGVVLVDHLSKRTEMGLGKIIGDGSRQRRIKFDGTFGIRVLNGQFQHGLGHCNNHKRRGERLAVFGSDGVCIALLLDLLHNSAG
ncbi:hypothetical protein OGAPHI_004099 [Ogataea philodendri]|uniref:Uncharacterized protein n=1 Tax=Ogataea philodendri TaxID=1378263 RepID=A0A9P8P632_9ASCO|nr:uncharacterized protein OGAPHI_004099 [Ogataea philodendri]KAH3665910.1 hypothetical protein OGAPHI_004099 [Ogataea philodendri]